MTQEDFYRMANAFDDLLNPEAIKNSVKQNKPAPNESIDPGAFFEHIVGFKIPKKKADK